MLDLPDPEPCLPVVVAPVVRDAQGRLSPGVLHLRVEVDVVRLHRQRGYLRVHPEEAPVAVAEPILVCPAPHGHVRRHKDASGLDRLDVPTEEHDRGPADKAQVAPVYGVATRVVYGPAGGGGPSGDVRLLGQGAAKPVVIVDHEALADHTVLVEPGDEHEAGVLQRVRREDDVNALGTTVGQELEVPGGERPRHHRIQGRRFGADVAAVIPAEPAVDARLALAPILADNRGRGWERMVAEVLCCLHEELVGSAGPQGREGVVTASRCLERVAALLDLAVYVAAPPRYPGLILHTIVVRFKIVVANGPVDDMRTLRQLLFPVTLDPFGPLTKVFAQLAPRPAGPVYRTTTDADRGRQPQRVFWLWAHGPGQYMGGSLRVRAPGHGVRVHRGREAGTGGVAQLVELRPEIVRMIVGTFVYSQDREASLGQLPRQDRTGRPNPDDHDVSMFVRHLQFSFPLCFLLGYPPCPGGSSGSPGRVGIQGVSSSGTMGSGPGRW